MNSSSQSILLPLGLFASIGAILLGAFTVVHLHFPNIYQPKRYLDLKPPALRNMFDWIKALQADERFVLDRVGLDAIVYLRFFKLGQVFFMVLSVFGILILGPLVN